MTLANSLVLAMAVQCAVAAILYALDGKDAQAVMFLGYVIANIGILWSALN